MKIRPEISPAAVAALCVLFYLDAGGLFLPFLAACAAHEAAHVLCVRACGGSITRFEIRLGGAQLCAEQLTARAQLLSTLAGPAASLLLGAATLRLWPRLAILSLLLGLFNLLPLPALDGGQALQLLHGEGRSTRVIRWAVLSALCSGALALACTGFGLAPVLFAAAFLARAGLEQLRGQRPAERPRWQPGRQTQAGGGRKPRRAYSSSVSLGMTK